MGQNGRKVVITGLGVFASTGKERESFFTNLINARSAVRRIAQFDPSPLSVQIAAEVPDYNPTDYFQPKRLDLLDRFTQFALLAAREAMESSGLEVREEERARFGVVIGSGMGGVQTFESGCFNVYARGATRLHPFTIPKVMHNAPTSQISMENEGPCAPYSMLICDVGALCITLGMVNGWRRVAPRAYTLKQPLSKVCTPPIPDPITTPKRGRSSSWTTRPLDSMASRAASNANCVKRSSRSSRLG